MTKNEEQALRDELAGLRKRASEIRALLTPRPEPEALIYLRKVKGPIMGRDIAKAIGKRPTHVSSDLSKAAKEGKAIRTGVGEFKAVSP